MSIMLDYEKSGGLVAAIAQDYRTGEVLMIAWMNKEAFEETACNRQGLLFQPFKKQIMEERGRIRKCPDRP